MQFKLVVSLLAFVATSLAHAYPKIDEIVPTAGEKIMVYRDSERPNKYWYIPQSIEPWTRDDTWKSSLYKSANGDVLSFVFRGQASISDDMLAKVAKANNTSIDNFAPVPYEYSKGLMCEDLITGDQNVTFQFPTMIGNYLEVVPVSLRVKTPDLVNEYYAHLTQSGLACFVHVGFKAQNVAYRVKVEADMDQIYDRFEAAMHGEYFIFELDIHTMIEHLYKERVIRITALEDASIPQSEIDKKITASMDDVVKRIIQELFTDPLKLPQDSMVGRGQPFSLRVDYKHSEAHAHWMAFLQSDKITVKDSLIGLRIAIKP